MVYVYNNVNLFHGWEKIEYHIVGDFYKVMVSNISHNICGMDQKYFWFICLYKSCAVAHQSKMSFVLVSMRE